MTGEAAMIHRRIALACRAAAVACALLAAAPVAARRGEPPYSRTDPAKLAAAIETITLGRIDAAALREREDAGTRAASGAIAKKLRVAETRLVAVAAATHGTWDRLDDGSSLWRIAVRVDGATDLHLGFGRFALPEGATLHLIGADDYFQGPYTNADGIDGRFRAPVIPGDTVRIELHLPPGTTIADARLELDEVGAGFRDLFGRDDKDGSPGAAAACNVNVVCPLGQPYLDQARGVAYYEFDSTDEDGNPGVYICTGTLIADVPRDFRNFVLTAAHCVSTASEAASMVLYWNYQSTQCSTLTPPPGGYFNDDQHGARLRATRADADFTLVELSTAPDPDWNLYYVGWDAGGAAPDATIGLHHPRGDATKVTAGPQPFTIDNCIGTGGTSHGTHWEAGPYSQGTTQGGSSGSGLFVAVGNGAGADRRLIGVLSGGLAACNGSMPNLESDCYGKFASAWNGPSASSRLRDWLDPQDTGTTSVAGSDPGQAPAELTPELENHRAAILRGANRPPWVLPQFDGGTSAARPR
jgi:hypothetical protein